MILYDMEFLFTTCVQDYQNDSNLVFAFIFTGTTRKRVLVMMTKMHRHK